jgi:hypothetical protein
MLRRLAITVPALVITSLIFLAAPAVAVPPDNDNFANRILLTVDGPNGTADATEATFEGTGLTQEALTPGASQCNEDTGTQVTSGGVAMDRTVWWQVAGNGGVLTINTRGSNYDTVLGVYDSTTSNLVATSAGTGFRGCNDDIYYNSSTSNNIRSEVQFPSVSGRAYWIQVGCLDGTCDDTVSLDTEVRVVSAPANDARGSAITITAGQAVPDADLTGATVEPGEQTTCTLDTPNFHAIRTVWYRWVAPARGSVLIRGVTTDDFVDNVLAVFHGASEVGCDDDNSNFTQESHVAFDVSRGDAYEIQLGAYQQSTVSPRSPVGSRVGTAKPVVDFTASLDQDGDGSPTPDDCNDGDPAIHPGPASTEIPNNDVDENCDGIKAFDSDGDKHYAPPAGDDCDDHDPNRFPGNPDVPGDGIDQDCAFGPAVRTLAKPRSSFVKGGSISVNGRPIKFAAKAIKLDDLTVGAKVRVKICHNGCRTQRFTAKGSSKRVWFSRRHRQVNLTGATIDVRVFFAGKPDIAGSYLLLKLAKAGAKQCTGGLSNGAATISGKTCRPR